MDKSNKIGNEPYDIYDELKKVDKKRANLYVIEAIEKENMPEQVKKGKIITFRVTPVIEKILNDYIKALRRTRTSILEEIIELGLPKFTKKYKK